MRADASDQRQTWRMPIDSASAHSAATPSAQSGRVEHSAMTCSSSPAHRGIPTVPYYPSRHVVDLDLDLDLDLDPDPDPDPDPTLADVSMSRTIVMKPLRVHSPPHVEREPVLASLFDDGFVPFEAPAEADLAPATDPDAGSPASAGLENQIGARCLVGSLKQMPPEVDR